jgi:hypothetical protein
MKSSRWWFAVVAVLPAMLLSLSPEASRVRGSEIAAHTLMAAQTAKQQCLSACRGRYRDCRHLNQLPSFECRGVYHDCTRYACAGLGPG